MLKFFRKLFQALFGGQAKADTSDAPEADTHPSESDPVQPPHPPLAEPPMEMTEPISAAEAPDESPPAEEAEEAAEAPDSSDADFPPPEGTDLHLILDRYDYGPEAILGQLYLEGHNEILAYTLERTGEIPAGTYALGLRQEGGRHAAYWYRFQEMHQGMLWLKEVPDGTLVQLCIGNGAADAMQAILLGLEVASSDQSRQVLKSEHAYRKLYPVLARAIQAGQAVSLSISDQTAASA